MLSCKELQILVSEFIGRPHLEAIDNISYWLSGRSLSSNTPNPYINIFRGLFEVTEGSNCLKLPAAAFRGLANTFSPFFSESSLI